MIYYDRIEVFGRNDFNKKSASKSLMFVTLGIF